MMYQHFNEAAALQCTNYNFTKNVAHITLFWKNAENSDVFTGKTTCWKLGLLNIHDLIFCIFNKKNRSQVVVIWKYHKA